ncbi:ergothioneine biosynthesis protein EgtB [Methylocapsa acidiphila]|uniref:ergothioneine biosynthesis protein EgtB n=1 Tax=Methylocapsa acidiphila TaxID=133552 RepID=UPI000567F6A8|nr:ergothioneine biosynthesis protein EgtB [Methylocapsa acidiphila]
MNALSPPQLSAPTKQDRRGLLASRLFETRRHSLELAGPLSAEDMTPQAMEDASPTKWHLAHSTWFFEAFVLEKHLDAYQPFDETFGYCFNSYYESLGDRQPRARRGLLTRPSLERVLQYREHVDQALEKLLNENLAPDAEVLRLVEIGVNHEQQHQELLLTDILALFAAHPLRPAYRTHLRGGLPDEPDPLQWIEYPGGVHRVGHQGDGFAFDNERPHHDALIHPFRLADRLVTNGEWLDFIADGGYRAASLWLSDGWTTLNRDDWRAPLYWECRDGQWFAMSLDGLTPVERAAPVVHVSYYEADAFSRWASARLPTEFEWEVAAQDSPPNLSPKSNAISSRALWPSPAKQPSDGRPRQMFGEVWQWTQSAYSPYPGYRPQKGALGEYNGKFMVGQQVLRGASFATPYNHSRSTYRNFFYPHQRWQFMGLRLASEITQ